MTQTHKDSGRAELLNAYEQLRQLVLDEPEAHSRNPYGLTLLLSQGLAVWMHTWISCLTSMDKAAVSNTPCSRQPAELENMQDIRSEVVSILTTMILAQSRKENVYDTPNTA